MGKLREEIGLLATFILIDLMGVAGASGMYSGIHRMPREVTPTHWGPELAWVSMGVCVLVVLSLQWFIPTVIARRTDRRESHS